MSIIIIVPTFNHNHNYKPMIKEKLKYSDYTFQIKRRSKLDPTKNATVGTRMNCPQCDHEQPEAPHGETVNCPNCGLYMHRRGNALYCVKLEPEELPEKAHRLLEE